MRELGLSKFEHSHEILISNAHLPSSLRLVKDIVVGDGPREVAGLFEGARIVEHGEGHRPLPSEPSEAERVCAAIAQFVRSR